MKKQNITQATLATLIIAFTLNAHAGYEGSSNDGQVCESTVISKACLDLATEELVANKANVLGGHLPQGVTKENIQTLQFKSKNYCAVSYGRPVVYVFEGTYVNHLGLLQRFETFLEETFVKSCDFGELK